MQTKKQTRIYELFQSSIFIRTNLSRSKEYLRVTEAVFIIIVYPIIDNLRRRCLEVMIVNLRTLAE